MSTIKYQMSALLLATAMALLCGQVLGQAQLLDEDEDVFGRPWPTYSLQNMPKTQFTCRDKILGGYYADPETQCQMFHVCVKLPGVGLSHRRVNSFVQQVQDYRFLCPNSTAFDQELQICANWADVDCDKSTSLYLNDLYRSVDESKSVNQEDESTFHLQRAESGDVRRSKENRVDQKSRPRHNYAVTASSSNADNAPTTKRPITSYYTPTTTTTTTTTTTERNYYNNNNNNYNNNNNNYNDDSKQDIDDIFKGSHSSHFFANRHGGREFDEEPPRPRPNDFNDYNRKTTEAASKTRVTPTRGQRTSQSPSASAGTSTTVAPSTKSVKKITLHASFNTGFQDYTQHYKSTTPSTLAPTASTTPRLGSGITSRFSFGSNDYQTQERIQPTTYNPNNGFRYKSTEQPSSSTKLTGKNAQDFDKETTRRHKPTVSARKQKLGPQESNYINHNEFAELAKPQPFQANQGAARKPAQLEPQYQRPRSQSTAQQLTRVGSQEPSPFKSSSSGSASNAKPRAFTSRGSITYKATTQRYADDEFYYPTTTSTANPSKKLSTQALRDAFTPTTFKPTTYKKAYEQSFYQVQQTQRPSQSPSSKRTTAVTPALPTTANPYANIDEDDGQYHPELYESDFPRNRFKFLRNRSTTSPTTSTSTTSAPVSSRQPHGFQQAHSHLRSQQQSAYQKQHEQEQSDLSDEDELFKTAQSLNFGAASINKLRADIYKAEKTSQQYNSQYSPQLAPSSPKTTAQVTSSTTTSTTSTTTTTRRPTTSTTKATTTTTTTSSLVESKKSAKSKKEDKKSKRPPYADEDTSYDYAYYDTA
ncbi:probable serine/threonine-protein kinase DDB_G0282963 isoform X1 [Drosophila navojoa]|uniref:probable serine/threonine-protein kinase DDB_G0282963 isoform X1 n=1 Tax=Drosophila navojoa TaxID=7232 RepID=UPI0011BDD648|nr:probable serine/threonine-protein kinase DDB_G0282963 isoform X1 [Drosophila navojoa]